SSSVMESRCREISSPSYLGRVSGEACDAALEYQRTSSFRMESETGAFANLLPTGSICQTPGFPPNCAPKKKPYCPVSMPAASYGVRLMLISGPEPDHF